MDVMKYVKQLERLTIDNSPAILTAFGVVGTLSTAYLTHKAALKANSVLEQEQRLIDSNNNDPWLIEPKEAVSLVWKIYIPPAISAVATVTAIIGSNHVSSRRAAGMAAAYTISERAFSEYRDKVIQKVGEKKAQTYRDEISQERIDKNPVSDQSVIITGNGEVLCHDQFTDRYFMSSMEIMRGCENQINHLIVHQGYASVSDLYYLLGLKPTGYSEEVGWNTDYLLAMKFTTCMSDDGRPCISMYFDISPYRKYAHFAGE